jgi:hypothetical protein
MRTTRLLAIPALLFALMMTDSLHRGVALSVSLASSAVAAGMILALGLLIDWLEAR